MLNQIIASHAAYDTRPMPLANWSKQWTRSALIHPPLFPIHWFICPSPPHIDFLFFYTLKWIKYSTAAHTTLIHSAPPCPALAVSLSLLQTHRQWTHLWIGPPLRAHSESKRDHAQEEGLLLAFPHRQHSCPNSWIQSIRSSQMVSLINTSAHIFP